MIGGVKTAEQPKLHRIGRQRNGRSRGEAIQMSSLSMMLVEVHEKYARTNSSEYMMRIMLGHNRVVGLITENRNIEK